MVGVKDVARAWSPCIGAVFAVLLLAGSASGLSVAEGPDFPAALSGPSLGGFSVGINSFSGNVTGSDFDVVAATLPNDLVITGGTFTVENFVASPNGPTEIRMQWFYETGTLPQMPRRTGDSMSR